MYVIIIIIIIIKNCEVEYLETVRDGDMLSVEGK